MTSSPVEQIRHGYPVLEQPLPPHLVTIAGYAGSVGRSVTAVRRWRGRVKAPVRFPDPVGVLRDPVQPRGKWPYVYPRNGLDACRPSRRPASSGTARDGKDARWVAAGRALAIARENEGWSQEILAGKMGYSRGQVGGVECGTMPGSAEFWAEAVRVLGAAVQPVAASRVAAGPPVCQGPGCSQPVPAGARGRPRKYCSNRCSLAASRLRHPVCAARVGRMRCGQPAHWLLAVPAASGHTEVPTCVSCLPAGWILAARAYPGRTGLRPAAAAGCTWPAGVCACCGRPAPEQDMASGPPPACAACAAAGCAIGEGLRPCGCTGIPGPARLVTGGALRVLAAVPADTAAAGS